MYVSTCSLWRGVLQPCVQDKIDPEGQFVLPFLTEGSTREKGGVQTALRWAVAGSFCSSVRGQGTGPSAGPLPPHCTCLGGPWVSAAGRVNPLLALFQSSHQMLDQINRPETLRSGVKEREPEDTLTEQGWKCSEGGECQK